MISFIHLAKNVNVAELGGFGDVILDACCQNIVSSDEIWQHAVEMSVLFVTSLQKKNPRSTWYVYPNTYIVYVVYFYNMQIRSLKHKEICDQWTLSCIILETADGYPV